MPRRRRRSQPLQLQGPPCLEVLTSGHHPSAREDVYDMFEQASVAGFPGNHTGSARA